MKMYGTFVHVGIHLDIRYERYVYTKGFFYI